MNSATFGTLRQTMFALVFDVLMLVLLDLPTHLVDARRQIFLPRGMLGRVGCPVDANPPVTLTVWTKDERIIDVTRTTRFKVQADGTLLIKPVARSDEGRYACTPYSSLGAGQTSPNVDIVVRGFPVLSRYLRKASGPLRHAILSDNYRQTSQNEAFSLMKCSRRLCVEWAADHFGLGLT